MNLPPLPEHEPGVPPKPQHPPQPAPQTAQIPHVPCLQVDEEETSEADEDDAVDNPSQIVPRKFWFHPPHKKTRWRLNRDKTSATCTWCQTIPAPLWYRPGRKRHEIKQRVIALDVDTGRVYARHIRKLHFRPAKGETTMRYLRRFHWMSHKFPLFLPWIPWIAGVGTFLSVTTEANYAANLLTLGLWCGMWFVYFLTGRIPWAHTFLIVTNKRILEDRWLPLWLPTTESDVKLPKITGKQVKKSVSGNIFGYVTIKCGTADSSDTTAWIENGIPYVIDAQGLIECMDLPEKSEQIESEED